jgi:hypothetical protein
MQKEEMREDIKKICHSQLWIFWVLPLLAMHAMCSAINTRVCVKTNVGF